jgi:hypothetical protein
MKKEKKILVNFYLAASLKKRLDAALAGSGVSRTFILNKLIGAYLASEMPLPALREK